MRSRITLLIGLSTVFLFLSIYGTPYVNGQSSTINGSSLDNETDPFVLRGSSNTGNTGNNDPAQADDESSTNSNNDDTSIANDESSTNSNNDDDGSSTNSNNDDSDNDGADDDNSSEEDKEAEDDRKFELPFP
jgi:hypothetical protein